MARTASKAPCDGRPGLLGAWLWRAGAMRSRAEAKAPEEKKRRRDTDLLRLLEDLEVRLDAPHAHGGLGLERELVGPQGIAPRQDLPSFEPQVRAVEPLVLLGHLS